MKRRVGKSQYKMAIHNDIVITIFSIHNDIVLSSDQQKQGSSCSFIQTCLQKFLWKLFALFQPICSYTNLAHSMQKKNKKQKTKEQIIILVFTSIFFCLGGRFGVSLVFYAIWCFLIIYSWSNLHLNINFLLSHYHRRLKLIANTLLFNPE